MHSFEEKYGRAHPVFYLGTYSQVSATNHIDANLLIWFYPQSIGQH